MERVVEIRSSWDRRSRARYNGHSTRNYLAEPRSHAAAYVGRCAGTTRLMIRARSFR